MVKRSLFKKVGSLAIAALLLALIVFVLVPPATAVHVSAGVPEHTIICNESDITFSNVNLTIRGTERIPVDFLNFSIFDNATDAYIASVVFYIDGTELSDNPSNAFAVIKTTTLIDDWYDYGYGYGYDERAGQTYYFGYGYGYGGNETYTDITVLYDITYTTHQAGTFYTKLSVNSTNATYASTESTTFTVYDVPWDGEDVTDTYADVVTDGETVNASSEADVTVDVSTSCSTVVMVANYSDNPGSQGYSSLGSFFDVYLPNVSCVSSLTVKHWVSSTPSLNYRSLYYWNTTDSEWKVCSNTGYTAQASGSYVGYVYATITSSTTPTLSDLAGLAFCGGEQMVIALDDLADTYYKQGDTVGISGYIVPALSGENIGIEVNDSASDSMFDDQVTTNATGHFNTSFVITTGAEGNATIYAGIGTARANQSFTYDKTAPSSTITAPASGAKLNALTSITGTASDTGTSVIQVEVQLTNGTYYWTGAAWSTSSTWLTATGTTSWSYNASSVNWNACGANASLTITSRATDQASNVETPGAGTSWTHGVTVNITTTADDIGAYHGFNITWQDLGMSKYKIYYDTDPITNTSGLTAKATVTGATSYECYDMPSDTWGETIYFAVTTVDENDVEAYETFIGNNPSSTVFSFKMEITGIEEITNTSGELGWEMHYKNRFLNDSLSGKVILQCLGPGAYPSIPNSPQWVSRSTMSVSAYRETGEYDSYVSKSYETGDYKAQNMLWSCLPSEEGYWEPYAAVYTYQPITIS